MHNVDARAFVNWTVHDQHLRQKRKHYAHDTGVT